jgi:hypothetical protein
MADSSTPMKTGEVRCQYSGRWTKQYLAVLEFLGSSRRIQLRTVVLDHAHRPPRSRDRRRTAPEGRFALIDNPVTLDVVPSKQKSISIHSELMYTRSLFDTLDMGEQGRTLRWQIVGRP